MNILFINPPCGFGDHTDLAPPLGLLTLASVARIAGYEVSLIDFNLEVMDAPESAGEDFYALATKTILEANPDVVAFTSMCMDSHVALEIASHLKEKLPAVVTVFGGTHFGTIAHELLTHFPFVDFVVSGEGEHALCDLLAALEKQNFESLPQNVFYRQDGLVTAGEIEPKRPVMEDLPFPAYDLVDLQRYFNLNSSHLFNYDSGRGCIFKCSFCYSPFQYGDAVRNKNPKAIVSDLRKLSELGANHIFFVQDNLLNSPQWAMELCGEIESAQLDITWGCYATYPQLKENIIERLGAAKCIEIFTGLDAVALGSQQRMNKRFFRDWTAVHQKLSMCIENGITPTCAFILEGPNQSTGEIDDTIRIAIECQSLGCEVHINTLSVYSGSRLEKSFAEKRPLYSPIKTELLMDAPPVVQQNREARRWPDLFPYHSTLYAVDDWEIFTAKTHTLFALLYAFPRTLHKMVIDNAEPFWDKLSYVNKEYVTSLLQAPLDKRRTLAICRFLEEVPYMSLSHEVKSLFQKEAARLVFSQVSEERWVNFTVDGAPHPYHLAWFFPLHQADAGNTLAFCSMDIPERLLALCKDALYSQGLCTDLAVCSNERIRILSLPSDFYANLILFAEAADSGREIAASKDTISFLKNNGLIW